MWRRSRVNREALRLQRRGLRLSRAALRVAWVSAGLALIAALAGVLALVEAREARPEPATEVVIFDPLAVSSETVDVVPEPTSSCLEFSAVTDRPDAARCFTADAILDPCFQAAGKAILVCPTRPSHGEFEIVARPSRLEIASMPDAGLEEIEPWALELANGQLCWRFAGASHVVGVARMNYTCSAGTDPQKGVIGWPDRSRPSWTATYGSNDDVVWEPVYVRRAWF